MQRNRQEVARHAGTALAGSRRRDRDSGIGAVAAGAIAVDASHATQDGPFHLGSDTRVTGEGVGFYFTGSNAVIEFDSNVTVDLTAPRSGSLAGVVFFEDRTAPLLRTHTLNSNTAGRLEGAVYLSRGRLSLDSNSTIAADSAFTDVIVRQLHLNSNAHLVLNTSYATTEVPRALRSGRSVLVNRSDR